MGVGGSESGKMCHVLFEWPLRVLSQEVIVNGLAN